jgi:hypothetical protein
MKKTKSNLWFSDNPKSAILVYIVSRYKEASANQLGRTIMQKICYFLKFVEPGIPLPYSFTLYNYGPFSQDLLSDMGLLKVDRLIEDQSPEPEFSSDYQPLPASEDFIKGFDEGLAPYKKSIDTVVQLVAKLNATDMELYATTHYIFWGYKNFNQKAPDKQTVINKVYEIKERKFSKQQIAHAFDEIKRVGMLG